ncbi:MAG: hypothetical protein WAM92_06475 [Mycobacterium sp.]
MGQTKRADIDDLTVACKRCHRLLGEEGWTVRNAEGITEWNPPPQMDFGKPRTDALLAPRAVFPAG